nr:MAG TPA_asm: hypothetical protein [Bacteriophage sp.]
MIDGIYIAGDVNIDDINYRSGFNSVIQKSGRIYIQHIDTDSSGNISITNVNGKIYTLLYV